MPISKDYFKPSMDVMIGQIVDLREDTGNFGPQLLVEFHPLGADNPRLKWYNAQTAHKPKSEWQRLLRRLREDFKVDTEEPNNVIGLILKIQIILMSFVTQEGEDREYTVWKPIKLYDTETEALEDLAEITEAQGESAVPAPTGIDTEILETATLVFIALGKNVETFTPVAAETWPGVDTKALVAAVS